MLSLRLKAQVLPSQPHSGLSCWVAADGTLRSVQPFIGVVNPKENPKFEDMRELRAGLPHSRKGSGKAQNARWSGG